MTPEGWELKSANDLCDSISVGIVIKPSQYYVEKGAGVKAFRSANVREGYINDSDWVYLSHEGDKKNKKSRVQSGDVLIVRTGYPGTACVVTQEFEHANAIDIVIARPKKEVIISEYLCEFTNSEHGKSQVLNLQGGMAQKHLNVGAYKALLVMVPPLFEQKKIAQILSTWDKALETVEKLIANSQQKKKALMQQLLTGKKRFPGFDGEWKEVRLEKIAKIVMGSSPSSKSYNDRAIGLPLIQGNADITKRKSAPRFFTTEITKECDVGDILLSVRAPVGEVSISIHHACIGRGIASIKSNNPQQHDFLYQWLLWHEPRWASLSQGSTFSAVNGNDIRSMLLLFPSSIKEQQKITSVLSASDQEIETWQQELAHLQQEKKALMQQLLTGKRRVKVDC